MTAPTLHPRLRVALSLLALLALSFGPAGRASTRTSASATPAPGGAPADALAPGSPSPAATGATLVLLSTTDVKGKSSPCGCHTPKGGLARRAAFADSVRAANPDLLVLDSGGFFPEEADYESAAAFMLDAMKSLGVDAAGLGESDLRFGRAFLLAGLARTKLPVTCANLFDRASGAPLVAPYVIRQAGRAKVGVFGLLTDKGDLGPSRDSLRVAAPLAVAERTVAELRARGATVIVCLAELGKVESEEVANVVDGIDLVIAGRKVPLFENGRRFRNTLVLYGGEQSHYIGRTALSLDAAGHAVSGEAAAFMLGPDVPEQPAMLAAVKRFEDGFNEELKRRDSARALQAIGSEGADADDEPRDHYVGAEVCARCHRPEYEQWKTTAHSRAWATLVGRKAEARPDCEKCHVVGFGKPGGFHGEGDAPRLVNVQCEMCHGMGTQHDATRPAAKLTEVTCRQCHDDTSSPAFSFEVYQPHIVHRVPSVLPPLPPRPATAMH